MGDEYFPPSMTDVGQLDYVPVHKTFVPVGWDEGENFRRDAVDGDERILHGSDQSEQLRHVPFESIYLK